RCDTQKFCAEAEGNGVDRDWPTLATIIDDLISRFDVRMADMAAGAVGSPLRRLRADILDHAKAKAALPRRGFTPNAPTGGGQTLASLGFALDHAKTCSMERIVYGIPFTSIIDQTAAIFCDVLGKDAVLEHHSAIEDERQDRKSAEQEGERDIRDKMRL